MNLNNFIPDYFDLIDKKIKSVNLKELENVIRLIYESLQKIKNNHDFRYLK